MVIASQLKTLKLLKMAALLNSIAIVMSLINSGLMISFYFFIYLPQNEKIKKVLLLQKQQILDLAKAAEIQLQQTHAEENFIFTIGCLTFSLVIIWLFLNFKSWTEGSPPSASSEGGDVLLQNTNELSNLAFEIREPIIDLGILDGITNLAQILNDFGSF